MDILLACPDAVLDTDPVVSDITKAFAAAGHNCVARRTSDPTCFSHEYDIVIPFDCTLSWFADNRLQFSGRPWVIAAVYRGKDVMRCTDKYGPNPSDWGINALIVSSPHYVSVMPALSNAIFCWRPESENWPMGEPFDKRPFLFGSVVNKIEDQDFSLAARVISKYSEDFVLCLNESEDIERLPKEVQRRCKSVKEADGMGYNQFSFYIPTPMVTDYRFGMLPYEYIQAITNGCWPLLISHPSVKPLENAIGAYHSLNSFDSMLDSAKQLREAGGRIFSQEDAEHFVTTPEEFVRRILIAHSRSVK